MDWVEEKSPDRNNGLLLDKPCKLWNRRSAGHQCPDWMGLTELMCRLLSSRPSFTFPSFPSGIGGRFKPSACDKDRGVMRCSAQCGSRRLWQGSATRSGSACPDPPEHFAASRHSTHTNGTLDSAFSSSRSEGLMIRFVLWPSASNHGCSDPKHWPMRVQLSDSTRLAPLVLLFRGSFPFLSGALQATDATISNPSTSC
jgi:hypothetical protein